MIVYGEREEIVSTRSLLGQELEEIRYGQVEAGVVDALCPECDDDSSVVRELRRIAIAQDYRALHALNLPGTIRIRPQEGFAYYAVYPHQFAAAARRFEAEVRPKRCIVLGVRSIGTTLSAAVARALSCPFETWTVRPRGHPFDRHLCVGPSLEAVLRARASDTHFLVVDEGPGLSGSSFASVAGKLEEFGVPDESIIFFPSHEPNPENFVSTRAHLRWARHRKYIEPFRAEEHVPASARDVSGGAWREVVRCDAAVQPGHERRKYLADNVLWKWAGLAHYGEVRIERARRLQAWTPPVVGLQDGFLLTGWMQGEPAVAADAELLEAMARYLDLLAADFRTGRSVDYERLIAMVRKNTELEVQAPPLEGIEVEVDGRMLPHEWIRTGQGWFKTDALDHHDDHFFPGCQDIAWDIAGAAVEFDIEAEALVSRMSLDRSRVRTLLPFYVVAYLAYRIGYANMASQVLGDSLDGRRFAALESRYRGSLHRHTQTMAWSGSPRG